jgi:hypothetical protein
MSTCFLVQTEKAYTLQSKGFYTIAFWDKNFDINQIELAKILISVGVQVDKIQVVPTYQKIKSRGAKKYKVTQFRPKKFLIKTKADSKIDDEVITNINSKITN